MENKAKGKHYWCSEMIKEIASLLLDLVGIVVTVISIIVTVISIWQTRKNKRHQKSNRPDQS